MYKKFLMLFLAFMITGAIFMSCSSDDDGGTTDPTPDPKLTIISPNGGEVLQMEEELIIRFDNDLTEAVSVNLYKAGEWVLEMDQVTGVDTLAWTIPTLVVDTDYSIKIESTTDSTEFDFSDTDFAIAPAGNYIIVTSSNGGDIWVKDSNHMITWYDNVSATVDIELYKNNAYLATLFSGESSDGSKSWTLSETLDAGADYSIRIEDAGSTASDISDNFFCVSEPNFTGSIIGDWELNFTWLKQPTVINFESDFTWYVDSLTTGTWSMDGNGLRFDFDDIDTYYLGIVEDNEMAGTMVDSDGNLGVWDADRVIPEVLTPNGGEVWMYGTTQTITWDTAIAGNVVLSLADTTGIVQNIATVLGSDGTHDWTVPNTIDPGATYLIRIAKEINTEAYDESDHYICISSDVTVDIIGEWYVTGSWGKWETIFTFNSDYTFTATSGSIGTWTLIGNGLRWDYDSSDTYYIGNVGTDVMNGTQVSTTGVAGVGWSGHRLLDVLTPNGGEIYEMSDVVNITWNETITADEITVDLYENDVFIENLGVVNVNNFTSFNWTIPTDIPMSTKYSIRLTSTTSDIYDECDDYFTISGVAPAAFEFDNFEDGVADNWTAVTGTWAVVDSVYEGTKGAEFVTSARFNTEMTDNYVYETKMRQTSASSDFFGGLILNGDPSGLNVDGSWDDCMVLMIEDGNYHFVRMEGGMWASQISNSSGAINTGVNDWNIIKMIVNNDNGDYHLFINDQYVETFNDATYDHGVLGLHMASATVAEFDYVSVSTINKSALDNIDIKYLSKPEPTTNPWDK